MSIAFDIPPAAAPTAPVASTPNGPQSRADVRLIAERVRAWMRDNVMGRDDVIELVLVALFGDGHVLLEDYPGSGKTTLANALGNSISDDHSPEEASARLPEFRRVQFTPDLLPSDLIGTEVFNASDGRFTVRRGPLFANLVLADEVNRAPAKVQSALLESMQERQVSIGGETFALDDPFLVMATMNPIEQEGTYPLPEAQLDRFLLKVKVDYPSRQEERQILEMGLNGAVPAGRPVATREHLRTAREAVNEVVLDDTLKDYIVQVVYATRRPAQYRMPQLQPLIAFGASPRASIALARAARAHAFLQGRGYTTPDDVKSLAHDVLRHRIVTTYEAEAQELTTDNLIDRVLEGIDVP